MLQLVETAQALYTCWSRKVASLGQERPEAFTQCKFQLKGKVTTSSAVTTVSVDVQVNITVNLDCGNRFPLPLLLKSKLSNQQHRKKFTS